jgi:hypothetical protein
VQGAFLRKLGADGLAPEEYAGAVPIEHRAGHSRPLGRRARSLPAHQAQNPG